MHVAPAWCIRLQPGCTRLRPGYMRVQPELPEYGTSVEPEHARSQARAAREEQAELDAKAASDDKPSLELPGGFKIGF